jgi:hypothetical protein
MLIVKPHAINLYFLILKGQLKLKISNLILSEPLRTKCAIYGASKAYP